MAAVMEFSSRMSPDTGSQCSLAMFSRLALGRISTRTCRPRATSACATAEPTKPDAPVTSTMSLIEAHPGRSPKLAALVAVTGPQDRLLRCAHRFPPLPIEQRRHPQHDFARPLEQRYRHTHLGGKTG